MVSLVAEWNPNLTAYQLMRELGLVVGLLVDLLEGKLVGCNKSSGSLCRSSRKIGPLARG